MLISVKAYPLSGKSELEKIDENIFKARIKSAPEGGKANKEIMKLLSEHYGIPVSDFKIIAGKSSRNKLIKVM